MSDSCIPELDSSYTSEDPQDVPQPPPEKPRVTLPDRCKVALTISSAATPRRSDKPSRAPLWSFEGAFSPPTHCTDPLSDSYDAFSPVRNAATPKRSANVRTTRPRLSAIELAFSAPEHDPEWSAAPRPPAHPMDFPYYDTANKRAAPRRPRATGAAATPRAAVRPSPESVAASRQLIQRLIALSALGERSLEEMQAEGDAISAVTSGKPPRTVVSAKEGLGSSNARAFAPSLAPDAAEPGDEQAALDEQRDSATSHDALQSEEITSAAPIEE